jgi:hypothetical protein
MISEKLTDIPVPYQQAFAGLCIAMPIPALDGQCRTNIVSDSDPDPNFWQHKFKEQFHINFN